MHVHTHNKKNQNVLVNSSVFNIINISCIHLVDLPPFLQKKKNIRDSCLLIPF